MNSNMSNKGAWKKAMPKGGKRTDLAALLEEYKALGEDGAARAHAIENQVISENYPLVLKLVGKFAARINAGDREYEEADLMQVGAIGMVTAWRKWIPAKAKFSTYAALWIKHECQNFIAIDQTIYRAKTSAKPWRIYRREEAIRAQYGRDATAEELGVDQTQIDIWNELPIATSLDEMTDGVPRTVLEANGDTVNTPFFQAADKKAISPDRQMELAEMGVLVQAGMESLTKREAYVIMQLFYEQASYRQIASALCVSEEMVRLERESALDKLRAAVAES